MHRFHLKVPYLLKKEINEIYLTQAIRSFAMSTIAIFIPIFLLKKGYSVFDVGTFLFFLYVFCIIFCYSALKFAAKKGVKHSMIFSVPTAVLFFLALYNIDIIRTVTNNYITILIIALLYAITSAYYWMGFHIEFAKFAGIRKSMKRVGIRNILTTIASILGPLFGALIITGTSFNVLFILVMILIIISLVPLFFSKEVHESFEFNLKKVLMSQGDEKSHPYLGEGVKDMAARLLWPILLYMVFTGLHNIGIIYAISNTILVFSTIYLSKKSSKKHKTKLLTLGVYFHSLTLVVRTLIKTFSILTIVQGFGALSWTMVSLPFQSIFYNNAKRQGIAYGIFFRELYLNFGRMVGAVLLMLLILFFQAQTAIVICIIIGAIAMIWMTKLREEFKKVPS